MIDNLSFSILFTGVAKYNNGMKKIFYRVEDGDTVFSLAERFSVSVGVIIAQNNLKKEIETGDMLYIEVDESKTAYKVQPFDTVVSVGRKFNVPPEKILFDNGVSYLFYGLIIFV